MPPRGWLLRISDILDAIAAIEGFTQGIDYATFAADRRTIDAVLHNLMTIGEAANHVPDDVVTAHPEIPWRDMRDIRNVVVHEYFGVNHETKAFDAPSTPPPWVHLPKFAGIVTSQCDNKIECKTINDERIEPMSEWLFSA